MEVINVPGLGLDNVTRKVLLGSTVTSPRTRIEINFVVSPGAKVIVPVGNTLPIKSVADAGLAPTAVTL